MTRTIKILFLISTTVAMAGCSAMVRTHYYSPSLQNGISEGRWYEEGLRLSGPQQSQKVDIGPAAMKMETSTWTDEYRIYSFGPAWLPVIPTVFNWFFPLKKIGPKIDIAVTFSEIKGDVKWAPFKSIIVEPGEEEVIPLSVEAHDYEVVQPGEVIEVTQTRALWGAILHYQIPERTKEFTVIIRGLSSNGKNLPEVPIKFTFSKGWVMGFIP